jgi:hypothetical protein
MRKPITPVLVVALVLALAACAWLFLRYRDTQRRYADMSAAEQSSRDSYSRTIDAIAEIQDSLDAIAPRDSLLAIAPGSLVTEQQMAGPNGQRALEQISSLRASIARNREKIRALEADLQHAGVRADGMRRVIGNMQRELAEKQASLDQLESQVQSLRGQVGSLQTEVQQGRDSLLVREAALEERRHELATVYYVVGTKDQLLKQGAIVMKGGVLGMGGTPVLTGQLPTESLTPLDTDVNTVITTTAAKARVLTPQAPKSYELRLVDGHIELHVLDAAEFRKVRQLVIMAY